MTSSGRGSGASRARNGSLVGPVFSTSSAVLVKACGALNHRCEDAVPFADEPVRTLLDRGPYNDATVAYEGIRWGPRMHVRYAVASDDYRGEVRVCCP